MRIEGVAISRIAKIVRGEVGAIVRGGGVATGGVGGVGGVATGGVGGVAILKVAKIGRVAKIVAVCVAFLVGVVLGALWNDGQWVIMIALVVVGGVMWAVIFRGADGLQMRKNGRKVVHVHNFGFLLVVVVAVVLFGVMRFLFAVGDGGFDEGDVVVEGCVVREVDVREDKVKYVIEAEGRDVAGDGVVDDMDVVNNADVVSGVANFGLVLVNADRYPVYEYGDLLRVSGELSRPEKIEDFDYDKYLARYGVYALMYRASVEKVGECDGMKTWFFIKMFFVKGKFEEELRRVYAEPHSSFMAGLILGSRKGIPDHLMEDFNATGLTHIIAISGWNITLVIVLVSAIFGFLGRKRKVIFAIGFIVCFCLLVGASAAVVRAGIMGCIALLALWFGRQYYVGLALIFSAVLMTLWNPMILVYDVGFQLSFLATMGLIYVSPRIEKWFLWLPEGWGIRESVLMTMSAQIMALPIIIYNFGRLSLISPIANVFVLPFIPLAMMFGGLAGIFGFVSDFLGELFGFVGYLILELIILFVKIFASIKFASIDIDWVKWWMVLGYYVWLCRNIVFRNDF